MEKTIEETATKEYEKEKEKRRLSRLDRSFESPCGDDRDGIRVWLTRIE